jgi:hypothetical protein
MQELFKQIHLNNNREETSPSKTASLESGDEERTLPKIV